MQAGIVRVSYTETIFGNFANRSERFEMVRSEMSWSVLNENNHFYLSTFSVYVILSK